MTLVQMMLSRIKKSTDLLDSAEEPYSDKQMVCIAYDAVLKTGVFSKFLKEWRQKEATDKTWANFKKYTADEYNDYLGDESAEDRNPY